MVEQTPHILRLDRLVLLYLIARVQAAGITISLSGRAEPARRTLHEPDWLTGVHSHPYNRDGPRTGECLIVTARQVTLSSSDLDRFPVGGPELDQRGEFRFCPAAKHSEIDTRAARPAPGRAPGARTRTRSG